MDGVLFYNFATIATVVSMYGLYKVYNVYQDYKELCKTRYACKLIMESVSTGIKTASEMYKYNCLQQVNTKLNNLERQMANFQFAEAMNLGTVPVDR